MAVSRTFGATPRRKVFVRVQEVDGQQVLSTKSFSVYGQDSEAVATVVEDALATAYLEEGEEPEQEPEPVKKPVIKKRRA